MKKFLLILFTGLLFSTGMFAEEIKLSFSKPEVGKMLKIVVNGHLIFLCNNQNWNNNTKDSWIKFHLNPESKVTFEKTMDRGFQWSASTPAKEKSKIYDVVSAAFLDLETFVFYEDGIKFIVEIQ